MSAGKALLLAALCAGGVFAHVGSPDVFFQGKAGPYPILVAIRPPDVIPGIAHVEVRALSADVGEIRLTPTPMTGEAAKHPPVADIAERSKADPQFYEGSLWLMSTGSWEVRIHVSGTRGEGDLPVPVPAIALRMKPMGTGVSYFLFGMMVFLTAGMVAIAGAAVREAQIAPGIPVTVWNRGSIVAMACASAVLVLGIWRGNVWWGENAAVYGKRLYKPLEISASLSGTDQLTLRMSDPGWLQLRKLDDLVPDHEHLMHLFLLRWPDMDEVFHLHPEQTATGLFATPLPSLPGGKYRIYGDIVHESGLAETAVGEVTLPAVSGKPLDGDDAGGVATADLGGGYGMVWIHDEKQPVVARALTLFSFQITGPDGKAVTDLEPYMGMGGHAEFIKRDGLVFAHVHPTGSVSMASVAVASPAAMAAMHETKIGAAVSFPYGVPSPGDYRIFVQLKRAGRVETGAFDLKVR